MIVTSYSCLMAIVWFSLFVLLGDFLRRKTGFLSYYSMGALLLMLALSVLRLCLPLEFPFTIVVRENNLLPEIQVILNTPLFYVRDTAVSIVWLLLALWLAGTVWSGIRLCLCIRRDKKLVGTFYQLQMPPVEVLLQKIADSTNHNQPYRLIISPDVPAPFVVGFVTPIIVLPEVQLGDEDLQYFVWHEWQHVLNKDQWIKLTVELICCILWWNPVVMLLRNNLEQALEIRCDKQVTQHLSAKEKAHYFRAILSALKQLDETQGQLAVPAHSSWMVANTTTNQAILQRFHLATKTSKHSTRVHYIFMTAMLLFFCLSYFVVIQPYHPIPIVEDHTLVTRSNAYILAQTDGTYVLFVNGQPFCMLLEEELNTPPHNKLPLIRGKDKEE
ncbi:M56 family metallopeptidase [Pygmaiobacter massiliensis]|uniref:M56 family metallopeptidase n=1 Tax=Pygmaiobacter massiliensis TaxID=1917873 RepID=UPI00289E8096|nr:M56 family metallopeptidase [Pygmaiobacter massiliensis]